LASAHGGADGLGVDVARGVGDRGNSGRRVVPADDDPVEVPASLGVRKGNGDSSLRGLWDSVVTLDESDRRKRLRRRQ
jgi:hypothetical protein